MIAKVARLGADVSGRALRLLRPPSLSLFVVVFGEAALSNLC